MAENHNEHEEQHEHMSIFYYILVFLGLVIGTIATYITAQWNLDVIFPGANTLLALLIAFSKMSIVVLFFMHVYWNSKLIWLTVVGTFVFLLIMFAFTMQDYLTRDAGIFLKDRPVTVK
jgi:cytochrome c oxidase subunit 4